MPVFALVTHNRPPLFIPRNFLHSIACGRGAGASSRYVDMNITTTDDGPLEFTNINRAEIGVLNNYIHNVLIPAMEKDGQGDHNNNGGDDDDDDGMAEAAMVVEAEENSDDVVDVKVSNDSDGSDSVELVQVEAGRGCRSKRRAAREAIQSTKQHYLKTQTNSADDDDQDSEDNAPYQFQPEPASNDEGGDDSDEEEDYDPEGKGGDDDEEESDGEIEVVVASDDDDSETEEDDDDDEASAPPKKKRRAKR